MPCTSSDILEIAEALQTVVNAQNDSAARSAISRAYYAAFLHSRDAARIQIDTREVHRVTIDHWRSAGEKKTAQMLDNLRISRNTADYDLGKHFSRNEASQEIKRAKSIIDRINKVMTS